MKVGYLQNIQSFETSVETGNLQSYEKLSILTAVNPILDGGGGNLPPPAGFLNIAQKPLGLGS